MHVEEPLTMTLSQSVEPTTVRGTTSRLETRSSSSLEILASPTETNCIDHKQKQVERILLSQQPPRYLPTGTPLAISPVGHTTPLKQSGFVLRVKMSCAEIRVFAVAFGEDFDLYFSDDEGLECDYWKKERSLGHQVFRNISNDVLMVHPEPKNDVTPVFEHMADQEMKPGCGVHFTLHYYKDYTFEEGLPVAFSVLVENKTYSMYCTNDGGEKIIRFREEEVPTEILDNSSDIIFIQKSFSPTNTKAFKFESSLMKGYFLAFKEENNLRKLILKQCKNEDQVDEFTKITVS
ncbi:interleukin-18 [Emydura macquarii macquarii]|uniref:interleukin-18 n=1 Tax=Emydura macquarii macquarii TaxID=1129001 RepID=UPI00352A3CE4